LQLGAICFVVFCATPIHEYAHALIATKLGDDTPRSMGRLTIDPKAHIDPIGAIMILIFGFGYAKPVQVRMRNFKKPKRDMALVALAGPVSNLLQSFVFFFIYSACLFGASRSGSEIINYLGVFFFFAGVININLAVFNLLPIPPLDGSRLLTALLPSKYYFKIMQYERYIQLALFALLFTGVLTTPLMFLSNLLSNLFIIITSIPFNFL
jgi:Zn-dependent protease